MNTVRCPSCGHDWLIEERKIQADADVRVVDGAVWAARKERIIYRCACCQTVVKPETDQYGHHYTPRWEGGRS